LTVLLLRAPAALTLLTVAGAGLLGAAWLGRRGRGPRHLLPSASALLAATAALLGVASVSALHVRAVAASPVAGLAEERAVVGVTFQVASDPRERSGTYGPQWVFRADVVRVEGRGRAWDLDTPVVVLADSAWAGVRLGQRVRASARLAPGERDVAALVAPRAAPEVARAPRPWWDAAASLRSSVRTAVADRGQHERQLMPALVDGDDSGLDEEVAEQFRATGLTHLLAVSGTNLTIVVGALLVVGRWLGVRGRWAWLLGACGVVGFVLLARTEPSVVRAAAMGSVALVGMGTNGLSRGTRALGACVLGLLLVDPWLAVSAGFALSVLATGGILVLAPRWRDALASWTPRWVAEAVAVPLAAQVACTPVVAGISGQVSLVAVAANLLVAPVVAPATVLGLLGGLVGLVWAAAGEVVAAPGAWCLTWVVVVAQHGAALPTPSVGWGTGVVALGVLTLLCVGFTLVAPGLLRRPVWVLVACGVLVVAVTVRPPTPGWPPPGWVAVMCDVGQGDALVLNAGDSSAVLVDAGPDPVAVDRCLQRLGVRRLPLVVLTHFDADHVDGLVGALDGRQVGTVVGNTVPEPDHGYDGVVQALGRAPEVVTAGRVAAVGQVRLHTLWPPPQGAPGSSAAGNPNDASVVAVAEIGGVRLLLCGDVEPPAQAALARTVGAVEADVLKVPHHGSRHQDLDWLLGTGAGVALVGVGEDNTYGHPSADVLTALEGAGAVVGRTDRDGDLAVVPGNSGVRLLARTALGTRPVGADD
ncbi:MAG: ComEC/Rec2 family competence protein, partial [Nocardioides sp.]|uniref:ComEC/Rec2 family competence protein n=1 Tax=Nocardioides sp. TaxID=35761 RepID=UPI003F0D7EDB